MLNYTNYSWQIVFIFVANIHIVVGKPFDTQDILNLYTTHVIHTSVRLRLLLVGTPTDERHYIDNDIIQKSCEICFILFAVNL